MECLAVIIKGKLSSKVLLKTLDLTSPKLPVYRQSSQPGEPLILKANLRFHVKTQKVL